MANIKISGIDEPIVYDYFWKLNQGDFSGVCQLFAEQGCLHAPFTNDVCGRKAIYHYFQAEAREMTAEPQSGSVESTADGSHRYQLTGKVRTQLFTVNVGWTIVVNANQEITAVTVTLLAALPELLGLRSQVKPYYAEPNG